MITEGMSGRAADAALLAWVVDQQMAELTGADLKLLLFILRWTLGAGQESAAIGYAQFADGTGITDRATLSKALARLEQRALIARAPHQGQRGGGSSTAPYRVVLDHGGGNPTVVAETPTVVVPVTENPTVVSGDRVVVAKKPTVMVPEAPTPPVPVAVASAARVVAPPAPTANGRAAPPPIADGGVAPPIADGAIRR